jgi:hypothetical protein
MAMRMPTPMATTPRSRTRRRNAAFADLRIEKPGRETGLFYWLARLN